MGNSIFSNGGLGIDLYPLGTVNANDAGDGDTGTNTLLNWPAITSATRGVADISIDGVFDSSPGTYALDAYASPSCDPSGNGEGRTYLGRMNGISPGAFSLTFSGAPVFQAGRGISLTATDAVYNTSEFSNCVITAECSGDTDCDGFLDVLPSLHEGPTNTNSAEDDCPTDWNALQGNNDGNYLTNGPQYIVDDLTRANSDRFGDACDFDSDNDGIANAAELNLSALQLVCPTAVATTNSLLLDTDGDRVTDGAECALGSNPNDLLSKPPLHAPLLPASPDTDNDGLTDVFEATSARTRR